MCCRVNFVLNFSSCSEVFADCLEGMGSTLCDMSRYDEARPLFERSLAVFASTVGTNSKQWLESAIFGFFFLLSYYSSL